MAKSISRETLTVGIFAVLAGLVAAYGIRSYLSREEPLPPAPPPPPATIKLPLAAQDLPADRVIVASDLIALPMTVQTISQRFKGMNLEQMLSNDEKIIGRRLKEPILRGAAVPDDGFLPFGHDPGDHAEAAGGLLRGPRRGAGNARRRRSRTRSWTCSSAPRRARRRTTSRRFRKRRSRSCGTSRSWRRCGSRSCGA